MVWYGRVSSAISYGVFLYACILCWTFKVAPPAVSEPNADTLASLPLCHGNATLEALLIPNIRCATVGMQTTWSRGCAWINRATPGLLWPGPLLFVTVALHFCFSLHPWKYHGVIAGLISLLFLGLLTQLWLGTAWMDRCRPVDKLEFWPSEDSCGIFLPGLDPFGVPPSWAFTADQYCENVHYESVGDTKVWLLVPFWPSLKLQNAEKSLLDSFFWCAVGLVSFTLLQFIIGCNISRLEQQRIQQDTVQKTGQPEEAPMAVAVAVPLLHDDHLTPIMADVEN